MEANRMVLEGRVAQAARLDVLPTGRAVCTFRVAPAGGRDGDETRVLAYGRAAEAWCPHLQPGTAVRVRGCVRGARADGRGAAARLLAEVIEVGSRASVSTLAPARGTLV